MKKKVISVLLSSVLMAGMLAGCGSDAADTASEKTESTESADTEESTETAAATDETSDGGGKYLFL